MVNILKQSLIKRALVVGCTGGGLPECKKDVEELGLLLAHPVRYVYNPANKQIIEQPFPHVQPFEVRIVTGDVISLDEIVEQHRGWLEGAQEVIIGDSSHGFSFKYQGKWYYGLWWGADSHAYTYGTLQQKLLQPVSKKAKLLTIADACHAGGIKKYKTKRDVLCVRAYDDVNNTTGKPLVTIKGFEIPSNAVSADNIAEETPATYGSLCACQSKKYAYGAVAGSIRSPYQIDSDGCSWFLYNLITSIRLCYPSAPAYEKECRKVSNIMQFCDRRMMALEHWGTAAWINSPPKTIMQNGVHDGCAKWMLLGS